MRKKFTIPQQKEFYSSIVDKSHFIVKIQHRRMKANLKFLLMQDDSLLSKFALT
jgi:hypothetical protein